MFKFPEWWAYSEGAGEYIFIHFLAKGLTSEGKEIHVERLFFNVKSLIPKYHTKNSTLCSIAQGGIR